MSHIKVQTLFVMPGALNIKTPLWYVRYNLYSFLWNTNTSFTIYKSTDKKIQTTNMYLFKTKKKNAFNIEGMPKRDH